jgi:hypothetical protein
MIKHPKKGQKKERLQNFEGIEMMPFIYSSYAIITEIESKKKIIQRLKLQYQEEHDKLRYCSSKK